jgi:hypothetical protein
MNLVEVTTLAIAQVENRLVLMDGILYRGIHQIGPVIPVSPSSFHDSVRTHAHLALMGALKGDIVQLTGCIWAQSHPTNPLAAPLYWVRA